MNDLTLPAHLRLRTEDEDLAESGGVEDAPLLYGAPGLLGLAAISQGAIGASSDQITNYRYGRFRDTTRSEILARETLYDQADDEIFRVTGQRIGNPLRADDFGDLFNREILDSPGSGVERYDSVATDPALQWHRRLIEMASHDPRLADISRRYGDRAAINAAARQLRETVTADYHEYLGDGGFGEQLLNGILGAPGMIAGALSTGSPEQIAQLAAGGSTRGLTLLERTISGATMGVVGQAAIEPIVIEDARRMGEEYSGTQIALDFIIAAGFGASIDFAGGVIEGRQRPSIVRETDTPLRQRVNFPINADDTVPGAAVQNALAGQAESLIVSAHSRDLATARTLPAVDTDIVALANSIAANDAFLRGEGDFPVQSRPGRVADPATVAAAARAADDTPAPEAGAREMVRMGGVDRPRYFTRFDPMRLSAEPDVFQYKRFEGGAGSTGRLAGVELFNPASSGKIKVFEYTDGRQIIADGHQRRILAQDAVRRGQDGVTLDGYLYREADGWTPREVRNLAAQKNLRETPGDPLDTSALIRDAPELLDSSVPQRSAEFRVARGLAELSPEAFQAVRAGMIEPRLGAVIGEIARERPEIQEALVRMFQQNPPRTLREASFIVHEALQVELFKTQAAQLSMFGDALELAGMRERAEILRISGNQLRADRRLFEVAERNADTLEEAGNIIAKEENARRADLSEALLRHLDTLATRPSPVSRLLRDVAERAAIAKLKPDVAANQFVNGLIDLFNQHGLVGLMNERPPEVAPAPPINAPMMPRLQEEARASNLRGAHDADDEMRAQSLAEVAVLRAMDGDEADMPAIDAIGHTPESDIARIRAAMDALGIDDPTIEPVAAALYARPSPEMEADARTRLEAGGDALDTFAEVAEQSVDVEVKFNPVDFDSEEKLIAALDAASMPELDKIQRAYGAYGNSAGHSLTRAEFRAAFVQEWRDANGLANVRAEANPRFALGDIPTTPLSTVAQWDAAARQAFPRYGKKLLETARLTIVQSIKDLPDQGRGFYARLFDAARTPEQRAPISNALEHVRNTEGEGMGLTDFYAWRGASDGRVMAAEFVNFNPNSITTVNFGELTPRGLSFEMPNLGIGHAVETMSAAMAAIDRDIATFNRPAYRFSGLTPSHKKIYAAMFPAIEPASGYVKATVGRGGGIFLLRQDVADRLGITNGQRVDPDTLRALYPEYSADTPMMRTKQRALETIKNDALQGLIDKAKTPPRRGAFARGRGIIGYSEAGQSWIVADNAPPEMARGLTLHELGVHVGMKEMLGQEGYARFLDDVARLHAADDPDIVAGYHAAEAARTPDSQLWEEAAAYAIQFADEATMSTGLRGLIDRLVSDVRAWLWRWAPSLRFVTDGLSGRALSFNEMRMLALGGLRHAANNAPRFLDDGGHFAKGDPGRAMDLARNGFLPERTGPNTRLDPNNPADMFRAEAERMNEIVAQLEHCK